MTSALISYADFKESYADFTSFIHLSLLLWSCAVSLAGFQLHTILLYHNYGLSTFTVRRVLYKHDVCTLCNKGL